MPFQETLIPKLWESDFCLAGTGKEKKREQGLSESEIDELLHPKSFHYTPPREEASLFGVYAEINRFYEQREEMKKKRPWEHDPCLIRTGKEETEKSSIRRLLGLPPELIKLPTCEPFNFNDLLRDSQKEFDHTLRFMTAYQQLPVYKRVEEMVAYANPCSSTAIKVCLNKYPAGHGLVPLNVIMNQAAIASGCIPGMPLPG